MKQFRITYNSKANPIADLKLKILSDPLKAANLLKWIIDQRPLEQADDLG